jgi:hypothetical protein
VSSPKGKSVTTQSTRRRSGHFHASVHRPAAQSCCPRSLAEQGHRHKTGPRDKIVAATVFRAAQPESVRRRPATSTAKRSSPPAKTPRAPWASALPDRWVLPNFHHSHSRPLCKRMARPPLRQANDYAVEWTAAASEPNRASSSATPRPTRLPEEAPRAVPEFALPAILQTLAPTPTWGTFPTYPKPNGTLETRPTTCLHGARNCTAQNATSPTLRRKCP